MGVITLTLITAGRARARRRPAVLGDRSPPGSPSALGTYLGGWRIIRTMGKGLTTSRHRKDSPPRRTTAAVILTSAHLGFALSTTQVCTGAIFGAGAARRSSSVHWNLAGRMVLAWAATLPAAALIGAATSYVAAQGPAGVAAVACVSIGCGLLIYAASRRSPVTALTVNDVPPPTSPAHLAA